MTCPPTPTARRSTRAARRLAAIALVPLVAVGAVACSGSEGSSDDGATTTTVGVTTGTGDPALGRLADLDGSLDGLSGGDLDCYRTSLAFLALSLEPAGVLTGAETDDVQQIQQDVATLRAQVPSEVAADFDTYAQGVQAFTAALQGVALDDLQDPATKQRVTAAGAAIESPEVVAAQEALEQYFARTCPSPGTTTTTAG